ncbi:unnamed protein product [Protopolystoma xenopodis]|uniref:Uncharacterized protein n=1 Tax=Protopolystoma xenopodis TaxID=117903 RepID=A0A3S5ALB9_9PLAT|nr:unnamed protein product [Protopolystoma xenopodis]
MRNSVDQFNQRRYSGDWMEPDFRPADYNLMSVLAKPMTLSNEFRRNYERWLEEEVFSGPINWDLVLAK